VPTTKSTPFVVSEDKGDTKAGPGKSMKNPRHSKRHLLGEATLNSEKVKSVALAIVKLHESEGISQVVS